MIARTGKPPRNSSYSRFAEERQQLLVKELERLGVD